ncbi:aldehyde oxidase GLOX1-like [Dendrobium catenatum]|uniref:Galactose oxidase n=1 Tax=Dendrobium catenatum TaxID=906689 RepID=A0A2I0WCN0_9ASPA|nr:aldehyde oxidase GLOX1-like [Dendrobium catenatum]PKU73417.1 hypothetical protein MA16_Dca013873 [Dendrobium catenatum]
MRFLSLPNLLSFLLLITTSTAQFPLIGDLLHQSNPIGDLLSEQPVQRLDHETSFLGQWEIVSEDSGVSAMHLVVTHENKAIMFDSTASGPSHAILTASNCRSDPTGKTAMLDCWAHAIEFDLETYKIRPLKVLTDPWCSSGGFAMDGTLVNTGGWKDGFYAVRYISTCATCDWRDYARMLKAPRWYATQQILDDGSIVVIGGRRSFNYEFIPAEKTANPKLFELPFLRETTDAFENNLYPFIHLSTDGNLFIFANNRSILLQPRTGLILRQFPILPGGSRNYPASAMSVLLPINLRRQRTDPAKRATPFPAQVLICGGAPHDSFYLVESRDIFLPALKSCGRITITDPHATWMMERMPVPRTMGDMLILPNGDILIINGATKGCAGWDFARDPAFSPLLYKPAVTRSRRWTELTPTKIARMYHASSAVLPDASVLVAGSNTNPAYNFSALFPTELRVEKFRPPYLDLDLAAQRPVILADTVRKEIYYAEGFDVEFELMDVVVREDVKLTMYAPPFTTHGFSMNQRLLVLRMEEFEPLDDGKRIRVRVTAPPSGVIAPPGWYMLFVVSKGLPSEAVWVHIQAKILNNY